MVFAPASFKPELYGISGFELSTYGCQLISGPDDVANYKTS